MTDVAKTRVESTTIRKRFHVVEDCAARLGTGGKALVIDGVVLGTTPERFNEGAVFAIYTAVHRINQLVLGECLAVQGAGQLAAAGGVHHKAGSRLTLVDGYKQSLHCECSVQTFAHGPADDLSIVDIEPCDYKQEPWPVSTHVAAVTNAWLRRFSGRD